MCARPRPRRRGGRRFLQLRAKDMPDADLRAWVDALLELKLKAPLIVNDRADIALAAGAAGVHLGQGDGSARAAREHAANAGRRDFIIGRSTHNATQFSTAQSEPIDYVALGPHMRVAHQKGPRRYRGLCRARRTRATGAYPRVRHRGPQRRSSPSNKRGQAAPPLSPPSLHSRASTIKRRSPRALASSTKRGNLDFNTA